MRRRPPAKLYEDWEVEDPTELELQEVRAVRDEIRGRVNALLERLTPERAVYRAQ